MTKTKQKPDKVPMSNPQGDDSNWEKVRQEVTCAICLELLDDPKSMPCLHTYCKKCLMEALAKRPHDPDLSRNRLAINCPLCRTEVALSDQGIEGLPSNFSTTRLVETVQLQAQLDQNTIPKCDACKESDAVASCCDCGGRFFLCTSCFKAHKNVPSTKNHMLIMLKDISIPQTPVASVKMSPLCQKHPEELLKLYCRDCEVLVCRDCVLVTHKSHDYSFVDDVIEDEKRQLKDVTLQELDKIITGTTQAIDGVEKMQANIISHNDQHIAQINTTFQEVNDMMNKHKKALLDKTHQITNNSLSPLQKQQDDLIALNRNVKKCYDFTSNTLHSGTNSEIMSSKKQMLERTKHLKELHDDSHLSTVTKPPLAVYYQLSKINVEIEKIVIFIDHQQCCVEDLPEIIYEGDIVTRKIILKDTEGKPICNAANIFTAAVKVGNNDITPSVKELSDGKYSVSFTTVAGGAYVIYIQINGVDITNSPLRVLCNELPHTSSEDSAEESTFNIFCDDSVNEFIYTRTGGITVAPRIPRKGLVTVPPTIDPVQRFHTLKTSPQLRTSRKRHGRAQKGLK